FFLSICTCESCRQKAGENDVDVDSAIRAIRVGVEQCLGGHDVEASSLQHLRDGGGPVADYLRYHREDHAHLLERICAACDRTLTVRVSSRVPTGHEVRFDRTGAADISVMLSGKQEFVESLARLPNTAREAYIASDACVEKDPERIVSLVWYLASHEIGTITVGNYGMIPDTALIPIKQAIRFAKRNQNP
ncbi:MAG: hypothetical protein ACYTHJ_21710, partial [Planctomycetota bacterium]